MPPSPSAQTATQRSPAGQIPSLTGFRGYAAFIVLVNHAGQFSGLDDHLLVHYGYFGVPCFFALSGALFALLYFNEAKSEPAFLGRYYAARFIRIFPVYWLVLAVYALTVSPVDWAAVGWHAVMGHGFLETYRNAINVPMWTLPVECGFYLLAPFIFVAMRRIRAWLVPRDAAAGCWHWTQAASLLLFTVALGGIGFGLRTVFAPDDAEWWKGTIFGRFSQFGLGVLTGLVLADIRSGVIRLPRAAGNWFTAAGFGLLLVQLLVLDRLDASAEIGSWSWLYRGIKLSLAVTACLLILGAACDSLWQRFLASRPLVYLGAISYALYLVQCASLGPVHVLSEASARHFLHHGFNAWVGAGLTMLVCLGAAVVVHHSFEAPVQKWLRRRFVGRPAA